MIDIVSSWEPMRILSRIYSFPVGGNSKLHGLVNAAMALALGSRKSELTTVVVFGAALAGPRHNLGR